MSAIHHTLLAHMFTIRLSCGFGVENRRSPGHDCYCLYKNGIEMSDWLSEDEMEFALQEAIEVQGREVIDAILKCRH